jgi:thiamine-monophosphate kinase
MELEFLQWLSQRLKDHMPNKSAAVRLGIGDDAALLDFGSDECVVTTDMLMDGTDFILGQHAPERIGRKALAVNLSDVAAMGAVPVAALVSLALPRQNALDTAQSLLEGMIPLANDFDVAIIGGDTNCWSERLVICITLLARCPQGKALRRSGAVAGDSILVTGTFGGSLAGKHFDFTPRVREALLLRERYTVHAACDVSDGLALDLSRIAAASRCGAVVTEQQIPLSDTVLALDGTDLSTARHHALDHALGDGEDFELILAVPESDALLQAERWRPAARRLTGFLRLVAARCAHHHRLGRDGVSS